MNVSQTLRAYRKARDIQ